MNKVFFIIFLFFSQFCCSQINNLVRNYSFEDTLYCPSSFSDLYVSLGWSSPTWASPDYFNQCSNDITSSIPENIFGWQYPKSGHAYAGFFSYDRVVLPNGSNYREYLQSELKERLIANKRYCVEFYISLSDSSEYANSNIGALFTIDSVGANNNKCLNYLPQINSGRNDILTDTNNWKRIEGKFIAQGNEKYITIGCFDDSLEVNSLHFNPGISSMSAGSLQSYYYIDDIFVWQCDCELPNVFTPNNNDLLNDFYDYSNCIEENEFIDIVIFDRWGNIVFENKVYDNFWNGENKKTGMPCSNGVYYVIINTKFEQKSNFIHLFR